TFPRQPVSPSNVGILFKSPYCHYFTSVRFLIMICVLQTQPGLVEGWSHHTSCCLVLSCRSFVLVYTSCFAVRVLVQYLGIVHSTRSFLCSVYIVCMCIVLLVLQVS